MSRIIDKIVSSPSAPDSTNVMWYDGTTLKVFKNGKWESAVKLMSEDTMTRLIETLDGHKMSMIEFTQDGSSNLEILQTLNLTTNYICNYKLSAEEIIHGTYYNGTISSFYNNEITLWDVNFETGVITKKFTVDCEFIGTEVMLDVCTSGSAESDKNLEKLTLAYTQLGDHFTVNIDAGVGVGKFIPSQGGEGHITTATGVNVHYAFGSDGAVTKINELDLNAKISDLESRILAIEGV
jgi:hypothetical protein